MAKTFRLPRVDVTIAKAFFPMAKAYNYEITSDEFDEFDNEGPGHYYGVTVTADDSDRLAWDEGLRHCKARGLHSHSLAGLELRWQMFRPGTPLPKALREVATKHADAEAQRQTIHDQQSAGDRLVKDEGLIELPVSHSHVDVNRELMEWLAARGVSDPVFPATDDLPLLADTGRKWQHCFRYYRLPSGDVLRTCPGIATSLYTSDRDLVSAYAAALAAKGGYYAELATRIT